MKLTRFRVQKYKCILDSGWVNLSDLTVLVGKNETGKTSLLQALHLFNPFTPTPYVLARDWPRGFRGQEDETQAVCTAEFQLATEEMEGLHELVNPPQPLDRIQVTRDYGGRIEAHFPDACFADDLPANGEAVLGQDLPQPASTPATAFHRAAKECRAEAIRLAHEGRFWEFAQLRSRQERKLSARSRTPRQRQLQQSFRSHYFPKLDELSQRLQSAGTLRQKARNFVIQRLPTFVYMDECRAFCGSAQLDLIKRRKDRNDLRPEDETFLALLALAGLNFDKDFARRRDGGDTNSEEWQFDLSEAEAALNRQIENHWGQARYQVQFRTDGGRFMTFVKSERDKAMLRLEERSKGFQWFFSFDLMLMHETRGRFKNCVILLDEPGLHLHPEGQQDLLKRLAEYAKSNTLIYTTHLPHMIELHEPDRIRIISESERGSVVSDSLTPSPRTGSLVVQAALGIQGRRHWQVAEQNLIVTSADDYWLLVELSNLFRKSGREGLPPEVLVTSAGGALEAVFLSAFMIGQGLQVVVLFDSDDAGRAARQGLVQGWLPKYNKGRAVTLELAEAIGNPGLDCSIEDIFPEAFYLSRAQKVHEGQVPASVFAPAALPPGRRLTQRVEAAMRMTKAEFNRRAVGRRITADIRQMRNMIDLPDTTRLQTEKLLASIKGSFSGG